jgi:carbon monoxide dehydrogenase subunit G
VRADYAFEASEPPHRLRWHQELEGTPFERLFSEWAAEARLEPAGDGATRVRLEVESHGRGWARFGGFMVRRAMKRLLDDALAGLEQVLA